MSDSNDDSKNDFAATSLERPSFDYDIPSAHTPPPATPYQPPPPAFDPHAPSWAQPQPTDPTGAQPPWAAPAGAPAPAAPAWAPAPATPEWAAAPATPAWANPPPTGAIPAQGVTPAWQSPATPPVLDAPAWAPAPAAPAAAPAWAPAPAAVPAAAPAWAPVAAAPAPAAPAWAPVAPAPAAGVPTWAQDRGSTPQPPVPAVSSSWATGSTSAPTWASASPNPPAWDAPAPKPQWAGTQLDAEPNPWNQPAANQTPPPWAASTGPGFPVPKDFGSTSANRPAFDHPLAASQPSLPRAGVVTGAKIPVARGAPGVAAGKPVPKSDLELKVALGLVVALIGLLVLGIIVGVLWELSEPVEGEVPVEVEAE